MNRDGSPHARSYQIFQLYCGLSPTPYLVLVLVLLVTSKQHDCLRCLIIKRIAAAQQMLCYDHDIALW